MHEYSTGIMRNAPGWLEQPASGATFQFLFRDSRMTIFPDGSWDYRTPNKLTMDISRGKWQQLQKFLEDFAAVNPL